MKWEKKNWNWELGIPRIRPYASRILQVECNTLQGESFLACSEAIWIGSTISNQKGRETKKKKKKSESIESIMAERR